MNLERIFVVGCAGSGKTTIARELAGKLDLPYHELDALSWNPDNIRVSESEIRSRIDDCTSGPRWILDGLNSQISPIVWPRATVAIWLNYSFQLVFWRALKRAYSRALGGKRTPGGDIETFRSAFFTKHSIPWWVLVSWRRIRSHLRALADGSESGSLDVLEFRRPEDLAEFMDRLNTPDGTTSPSSKTDLRSE